MIGGQKGPTTKVTKMGKWGRRLATTIFQTPCSELSEKELIAHPET